MIKKRKLNTTEKVPIRYLSDNLMESYKKIPFRNNFHFSTYYKYLKKEKIFKKPHRFTDLCNVCEWAKDAHIQIKSSLQNENFQFFNNFAEIDALKFYDNLQKQLTEQIKSIESVSQNELNINEKKNKIINFENVIII